MSFNDYFILLLPYTQGNPSSEHVTRAMRGQPKRLSRNYLRRNSGKLGIVILYNCFDFEKTFQSTYISCILSLFFVRLPLAFLFFFCSFSCHFFLLFIRFIKQTSLATSTMAVFACVIIVLSRSAKINTQHEKSTFCVFE